jgi:hypothetical protein
MDAKCDLLRHTVATLAYRATRALQDAPESFAEFSGAGRTPAQILAHMGDLMDWALSMVEGRQSWRNSEPLTWNEEKQRFFAAVQALDRALAASDSAQVDCDRLFQGPVADAINHVGQIAMLRRLAGCKIPGENYYVAQITTGRTGDDQPAPVRTF